VRPRLAVTALLAACGGSDTRCRTTDPLSALDSVICGAGKRERNDTEDMPAIVYSASATHRFVAAPGGSGTDCTDAAPCSLQAAKAKVVALQDAHADGVLVELHDGVYRQDAPLRFSAADSGSAGHPVIWRARDGAHPTWSGALRVTGWSPKHDEAGVWTTPIPRGTRTRQPYIDGVHAPIAQAAPPVAITGSVAADATYASFRNPTDIELVFTVGSGPWTEPRCRIAAIDGMHIAMQQPCWNNATNRPRLAAPAYELPSMDPDMPATRIENAYELMQPGQWYLDTQASTLFYRALAAFDIRDADVELPVLEQLLLGEGTVDAPVHDIAFVGIELAHATWNEPSSPVGFAEIQANIRIRLQFGFDSTPSSRERLWLAARRAQDVRKRTTASPRVGGFAVAAVP
jgi:hypothetical protein